MHRINRPSFWSPVLVFSLVGLATGCFERTGTSSHAPGILQLSTGAEILTLDPHHSEDFYAITEASRVYESLYEYHYLKRPYRVVPALAERLPEISPDGLEYTIHLRPGVFFHPDACVKPNSPTGRELRAADVVYSYERIASPKDPSAMWYIFDGKIVGLNEWRAAEAKRSAQTSDYDSPVAGLRAIDPYTVKIRLAHRSPSFLWTLAMNHAAIVARECVDHYGAEFGRHPVGTGPFIAKDLNLAMKLTYVRNPRYWGTYPTEGDADDRASGRLDDAGKRLPLAEGLEVTVFREWLPAWLHFQQGNLSLFNVPKDLLLALTDSAGKLKPEYAVKQFRIVGAPSMHQYHFSFNLSDPVVGGKNPALRQAILAAIDVDEFIRLFYPGRAIKMNGFIRPDSPDYDPAFHDERMTFDPKRAPALLVKAGHPGGRGLGPITFTTIAGTTGRQTADFIEHSLRAAGISVEIQLLEWPEFSKRINEGKLQTWILGMGQEFPDAQTIFGNFWGKNLSRTANESAYRNLEYDALYEKMVAMDPGPARKKILSRLNRILTDDAPQELFLNSVEQTLTQPGLRNFKPCAYDFRTAKYWKVVP